MNQNVPIRRLTLYKHGIGFYERSASVQGDSLALAVRHEDLKDLIKSLNVVVESGQVLAIEYPTPHPEWTDSGQYEDYSRNFRSVIHNLRGRHVKIILDQGEIMPGLLVGIDELPTSTDLDQAKLSWSSLDGSALQVCSLSRVKSIQIIDRSASETLKQSLNQLARQVSIQDVHIRLPKGSYQLRLNYLAPAPTWRVSYRVLVEDTGTAETVFLHGWGVFDNTLDEDLENVELSLVAGMPFSFLYDMVTPYTPQRPKVQEERRVAPGPVEFSQAFAAEPGSSEYFKLATKTIGKEVLPAPSIMPRVDAADLSSSTPVQAQGAALAELFQYTIETPVSVARGCSAMVPILGKSLRGNKQYLYNGAKFPKHPLATIRLKNDSGLTLERGPVVVYDHGSYVGEAILAVTQDGGEAYIPYAVELGVKVTEKSEQFTWVHGIRLEGRLLQIEEWHVQARTYQLNNTLKEDRLIWVEHPRTPNAQLVDSPTSAETTADYYRFTVGSPAGKESTLVLKERTLVKRHEELRRISYAGLAKYFKSGLIDQSQHDTLTGLLRMWEEIEVKQAELNQLANERAQVYQQQEQIRGNLGSLSNTGREGTLRSSFIDRLEATENTLAEIGTREAVLKAEISTLEVKIEEGLKSFAS